MYYDECKKMKQLQLWAYQDEVIDGKPRYRWYKLALNSVYMISMCDDNHDIDKQDFSDLKTWYEATDWVAQNAPDALVHIMHDCIQPVTAIVKEKLLEGLSRLGYFKASATVQKHLGSYAVPKERTKKRYLEKAEKYIETNVVSIMNANCSMLENFKKKYPEKLVGNKDTDFNQSLAVILNIGSYLRNEYLDNSLLYMEWMRVNTPEQLKELFSFEVSIEIKEQLLGIIVDEEFFRLHKFINETIIEKTTLFYFEVPPYIRSRRAILGDYFDMNEDDDD